MSEELNVHKCGTKAVTILGNHESIITALIIRYTNVLYELCYEYEGEFKTILCHESEFQVYESNSRQTIGF